MENSKKTDKHLLAQQIRFNAHMLDVATKTIRIDEPARQKNLDDLTDFLREWDLRKYFKGPDIIWAEERILNYKKRISSNKISIKEPDWTYNNDQAETLAHIIKNRRSVRFWQQKPVEKEKINRIIEAGTYAPTAFNRMEWRFYVAETPLEDMLEGDASNPSMFEKAPVRIFIAIDERLYFEKYSGSMDTGLAMQNMILMAHVLGLSTCLIYQGEFVDPKLLNEHYNIPENLKVYCAITLGYPADDPEIPARMNVDEVTEFLGVIPNPQF